jgi:hypothetical protein
MSVRTFLVAGGLLAASQAARIRADAELLDSRAQLRIAAGESLLEAPRSVAP